MVYHLLPDVASGAYFPGRVVFSVLKYFSVYTHLSMWSFYRTFERGMLAIDKIKKHLEFTQ